MRLSAMDGRGPRARVPLGLIATHPGRRAGDVADLLGRGEAGLKIGIRKPKNLGPRGAAVLRALGEDP
ncbi:hypothetical protein [Amycolatopsis minnesotensis]